MTRNTGRPIACFDSGVGGLTVARAIKTLLPDERIVYFGDTARVPYGPKSAETVTRYSLENTRLLRGYDPKLLVIACNTSSAYALEAVTGHFDGPVIGVVRPGASAAVQATRSNRVGILGTRGTIASGAYQSALAQLEPAIQAYPCPCGLFVPIVEERLVDHEVARLMADHYLQPLLAQGVDTLILGCTHYPLLTDVLAQVAGQTITLVSSAQETARQVQAVLEERGETATTPAEQPDLFLASDDIENFQTFFTRIFPGDFRAEFRLIHS